jgi:ring-1,2-phenylacetyl-CoA epoxidase subunit PaaD
VSFASFVVQNQKKMETITNKSEIFNLLEQVPDPEVPVLTIIDLGIVRDVKINDEQIEVVITPTYSGCPAMDMIAVNIKAIMQDNGYDNVSIKLVLSPAWTTDWMSENGKKKLKAYGIAPPVGVTSDKRLLLGGEERLVCCPLCDSNSTRLISQFGSTACKSLYQCKDCLEPFDYFKCH